MNERLSSGIDRLDEVMGGGVLTNSIVLLGGAPGTGKSMLAQQYVSANADRSAPALIVSTVSEPLDKTVRFAQSLSFFDPTAVGDSLFFEDGGAVLRRAGLDGLLAWLTTLVHARRPSLVVIDSLKALAPYGEPAAFRAFLYDLANLMGTTAATSLWLGEYPTKEELTGAPEAAVADAIVHLRRDDVDQRELRSLQVLKLRGSGYASGQHAYRLDANGMHVFPRLAVSARSPRPQGRSDRVRSGLPALDAMVDGGFPRGSSTLVAGPTGSGKTLFGLQFLAQGASEGERGVIATLQDPPDYIEERLGQLGDGLPGDAIATLYRSPVDVYIDEWVYEVLELVERQQARRVVIDGLTDLDLASADPVRFREYLSSLVDWFAVAGVTAVLTQELPMLFRIEQVHSEAGYSNLCDSVVLVQYLMGAVQLQRALTVLKTQGSSNDLTIRRFTISRSGIDVGDPLAPRGEVMG